MPLTYDTTRIKYFKENPDELSVEVKESPEYSYQDLNPETKSLVFGSMMTDIGSLTIKSACDYYARYKIMEKYDNMYFLSRSTSKGWEKVYLTPEILIKHLGLQTNVINTSKSEWIKRICNNFSKDRDRDYKPTEKELSAEYKKMVEEFDDSWLV